MPRYYDIDDILAEEELVPCTTLMDFTHLAHLDPDYDRHDYQQQSDRSSKKHFLPENSRIKVAVWAVEKWATLGFVRLSLPRLYHRRALERLQAEPAEVDLRKRNERFFLSGCRLVSLIETANPKLIKKISTQPRNRSRGTEIEKLHSVLTEARELRTALLSAYTGDRLRNTLDWSLSSVGEDVTAYTERLTEMERRLFLAGAKASAQQFRWKVHGFSRRAGRGQLRQQPVLSTALPQHHGGGALEAASSSPDRDSRWGKRPRTR